MNLTDKEIKALGAIIQNGLMGMNGQTAKDLLIDNFSWFDRQDISDYTGLKKHEAAGLMSSLNEKGLVYDTEGDGSGWCLSESGIEAAIKLGM